jgi:hypothetical protein
MLNITRYVVRNLSVTKNLFASTATLTSEKTIQSIENKKVEKFRKPKSKLSNFNLILHYYIVMTF